MTCRVGLRLSAFSLLLAGYFFLLLIPATASGSEKALPLKSSGEISLDLDQTIERAQQANRFLLQNALLVQNSQYSPATCRIGL